MTLPLEFLPFVPICENPDCSYNYPTDQHQYCLDVLRGDEAQILQKADLPALFHGTHALRPRDVCRYQDEKASMQLPTSML